MEWLVKGIASMNQPIVWIVSTTVFLLGVIGFLSILFDQADNPQSGDLPGDEEEA